MAVAPPPPPVRRTNAFAIARILGYDNLNVVFVDGHAISFAIDEVWHRLFKRVFYIRHLEPTTCFDRAIFISWGWVPSSRAPCTSIQPQCH